MRSHCEIFATFPMSEVVVDYWYLNFYFGTFKVRFLCRSASSTFITLKAILAERIICRQMMIFLFVSVTMRMNGVIYM